MFSELGDGRLDRHELNSLLANLLSQSEKFEDYAVDLDLPGVGRKQMLLNARKIIQKEHGAKDLILLAMEEATSKK